MMSLTSQAHVSLPNQLFYYFFNSTHAVVLIVLHAKPFCFVTPTSDIDKIRDVGFFVRVKFSVENDDTERQILRAYSFV